REQAALLQAAVLRAVELVPARRGGPIRPPFLRFRRQRGNFAVRRIGDQRSAQIGNHGAALAPELVIGAAHVGRPAAIAAVAIHLVNCFLLERGRFGGRQRRLACKLGGPLPRRGGGGGPDSLDIRLA